MRLSIGEIIEKVKKAKTKAEKIEILQKEETPQLKELLRCCYSPEVTFLLPKGEPKFRRSRAPLGLGQQNLYMAARKMYLFIDGGSPSLTQEKREKMFLDILEDLDEVECEIFLGIKDKNLGRGITKKMISDAFPGLIPPKKSEEKDEEEDDE